ncbi:TRAP transporter large permease [Hydrogenophaga sp.]|uniref:TRAP transporter large permease n=1 Tax=Hydrogenophaga sp. TaxID=1904254 RepID=UPI0035681547
MTPGIVGLVGVAMLVVMILGRVPVATALGLVGVGGYAALEGWPRAAAVLGSVPLEMASAYTLSVVPLFTLMGAFATTAGLSSDLFRAANAVFAGRRGSLALAAIGASAGFGAVCGSSLATAATMSKVSIPEMIRAGYSPALASGAVAAGGTIGILIPPSLILMIYGIIAQQSVAKLFAAALIPGLILTAFYLLTVVVTVKLKPSEAPKLPSAQPGDLRRDLFRVWDVAALFLLSFGGIYLGWFSPTEAAAIGAFGAALVGWMRRRLPAAQASACVSDTVRITANLTLIVLGSTIFSYFVVQSGIASTLVEQIAGLGVSPTVVMLILVVFYIVLGCFLEGIGMVLITVPILLPLVTANQFDPVWFGVLLVILVEIGLITPPVGMNLFVIRAQAPSIGLPDMFRGVLPFLVAPIALIALLLVFPQVALWLPGFL